MNFIKKTVSLMLVCAIMMSFILIRGAEPAEAATEYYTKITLIDVIENYNSCTGMQGMAMDDTYIYNVKINSSTEANAIITRTHRTTGATTYLTNASTGTYFFSNLGHANDMEIVTVNGVQNLLVATGNAGSEALLRFTLSGTKLTQVANYTAILNGSQTGVSSAQVMRVNGSTLDLMIKKNKYLYYATLDTTKTSGEFTITHAFTLDVANVWINGKTIDMTEWLHQGFEYHDNRIFVPITGYPDMSASSIVVYNTLGATGTIQNDPDISFYVSSSTYEKFEIESCEICPADGKLYFNTNQATSSSANYDSVYSFTDYVYDPSWGAAESDVYRWETTNGKLQSVTDGGAVYNGLAHTQGNISGTTYTDARFSMSKGVVLKHDEPWILEWKSSGTWTDGGLLMSAHEKSKYEGNRYIFRRKNSTLIALGEYSGGTFYNYGLDLASYGVDGTKDHVYRMTNKLNSDGTNMVYLSVDGKELGAMNNYYLAGTAQGTTSNWISGKDFTFSYFGTDGHPLDECTIDYIQVWGKGKLDEVDEPDNFYWGSGMTAVTGTNLTDNTATLVTGSVSGTTYTDARFELDQKVVLRHDRPWSVEFKSTGAWSSLLLAAGEHSQTPFATFLFRNNSNGLLAFGQHDGSQFNNYGIALTSYGIDVTATHTYRLTNRIAADGSNMVYVYVDGEEIGPMNGYFVGGGSRKSDSDWISGKDFTFTYLGTAQHNITTTLNYLKIWENGIPAEHSAKHYRWEVQNNTLTSITTGGFTANNANVLSGSISGNTFTGSYFRLDAPVVLVHDRNWSIQWQSEGSWKDLANGSLLLSNSIDGSETNTNYLYRRNDSHIIAFGERLDGYHQNYGIKLSDKNIDGTAAHTYRLENRVNADGSNMVYLFVDGVELGAMNQYFKGGTAQNTTSNWISGKDFTFAYLGNPNFPIGNCSISYLQVDEGCTHSFGAWSGTSATCTADGVQTRSCTLCGITESKTIAATGHSYKSVVTAPTCTTAGYTTYTCSNCGHSYTGDNVAVGGHSYTAAVTQPTCEAAGYTTYTCTLCGNSYVGDSVAATGHRYQTVVTAPTCTEKGYSTYTCSNCSDTLVGSYVDATGHSYVDGYCTACGVKDPDYVDMVIPTLTLNYPSLSFEDEILYNVYYTIDHTSSVVEMGLAAYAYKNTNGTVANALEVIPGYVSSGSTYMVQSKGIPAKNLADAVYFKVYAKLTDGSYVYTDVAGYNAVAYANTVLGKSSSTAKAKALVVAMLNYGAAAQEYFGYKTDALMNAALTAEQQALVSAYSDSMVADVVKADSSKVGSFVMNGGYSNIYPTVSFEGAFSINFYFTPNKTVDDVVTFYYWDAKTYNSVDVLTPENATGVITMAQSGKNWGTAVEGIAAKAIDETVYVAAIYTSNGVEYPTGIVAYSLGNYCKTLAGNGTAFGAATAVYGYYAKAYFA